MENMREVEKRHSQSGSSKESNKASYEDQKKGKSLQNRLSKIESQIKQLEGNSTR
jgi:ATP-binding cassette subfamily F protein 3